MSQPSIDSTMAHESDSKSERIKDSVVTEKGFLHIMEGVLRQRESFFDYIFEGREIGRIIRLFLVVILVLSAFYGVSMGAMAFSNGMAWGFLQMISSGVKLPILYLLSVGICYPVLFVINVLMGSKLSFLQTFALILLAIVLNSVLLASCAPIALFFTITGANYHFVKLLHVGIATFSGCWAMVALWQGLTLMCEKSELYPKKAVRIIQVWILVFGLVGTQMAWSLRPFVGSPGTPFELFRTNQGDNFYVAVYQSIISLGKDFADKRNGD